MKKKTDGYYWLMCREMCNERTTSLDQIPFSFSPSHPSTSTTSTPKFSLSSLASTSVLASSPSLSLSTTLPSLPMQPTASMSPSVRKQQQRRQGRRRHRHHRHHLHCHCHGYERRQYLYRHQHLHRCQSHKLYSNNDPWSKRARNHIASYAKCYERLLSMMQPEISPSVFSKRLRFVQSLRGFTEADGISNDFLCRERHMRTHAWFGSSYLLRLRFRGQHRHRHRHRLRRRNCPSITDAHFIRANEESATPVTITNASTTRFAFSKPLLVAPSPEKVSPSTLLRPPIPYYRMLLREGVFIGSVFGINRWHDGCHACDSDVDSALETLDFALTLESTDSTGQPWTCSICSLASNDAEVVSESGFHHVTPHVAPLCERADPDDVAATALAATSVTQRSAKRAKTSLTTPQRDAAKESSYCGALVVRNTGRVASLADVSRASPFTGAVVVHNDRVILANACGKHFVCVGCIKRVPVPSLSSCISLVSDRCSGSGIEAKDLAWVGIQIAQSMLAATPNVKNTGSAEVALSPPLCPNPACFSEKPTTAIVVDTQPTAYQCRDCDKTFCSECRANPCHETCSIGAALLKPISLSAPPTSPSPLARMPSLQRRKRLPSFSWLRESHWTSEYGQRDAGAVGVGAFVFGVRACSLPERVVINRSIRSSLMQAREVLENDRFRPRCSECGLMLEKSVACNAIKHCQIEHCWVCGASACCYDTNPLSLRRSTTTRAVLPLSHWKTDGSLFPSGTETHPALGPCPRWDSDALWKRTLGVKCVEGRCYDAEKTCTEPSHAAGLVVMEHHRKTRQLIGISNDQSLAGKNPLEWLVLLLALGSEERAGKRLALTATTWSSSARHVILDSIAALAGFAPLPPLSKPGSLLADEAMQAALLHTQINFPARIGLLPFFQNQQQQQHQQQQQRQQQQPQCEHQQHQLHEQHPQEQPTSNVTLGGESDFDGSCHSVRDHALDATRDRKRKRDNDHCGSNSDDDDNDNDDYDDNDDCIQDKQCFASGCKYDDCAKRSVGYDCGVVVTESMQELLRIFMPLPTASTLIKSSALIPHRPMPSLLRTVLSIERRVAERSANRIRAYRAATTASPW